VSSRNAEKPRTLNASQERFVAEYLVDLNATQAAIRAGYSAKTAEQQGSRLLRNVQVAEAVAKAMEQRRERTTITQDRVLEELAILAFSDVNHYGVDANGVVTITPGAPKGAQRAISSIKHRITTAGAEGAPIITREVEIKLWDKPGPLKLAGRHVDVHGFADRVEVTGKNGGPVKTQVSFVLPDNGRRKAG
jgi:phage terminase small subunit